MNVKGKRGTFTATNPNVYPAAEISADGRYRKVDGKRAIKEAGSFDGACAGPDLSIGQQSQLRFRKKQAAVFAAACFLYSPAEDRRALTSDQSSSLVPVYNS